MNNILYLLVRLINLHGLYYSVTYSIYGHEFEQDSFLNFTADSMRCHFVLCLILM